MFAAVSVSPAHAIQLPSDDEQNVLIRTALTTFNDANMTGNYTVLLAKASKEFQSQITAERLAAAFKPFRTNALFFEDVVSGSYDASEKAAIDSQGALALTGRVKTDDMEVKYSLRFVQNDNIWKLLGINVDAKKIEHKDLTSSIEESVAPPQAPVGKTARARPARAAGDQATAAPPSRGIARSHDGIGCGRLCDSRARVRDDAQGVQPGPQRATQSERRAAPGPVCSEHTQTLSWQEFGGSLWQRIINAGKS
jgi:hypothetical protein